VQVIVLGSGSPLPDPARAGPSTLVRTGAGDLLFDRGRGVLMRAAAAGTSAGALQGLFLTHLHSDHTTDLNDVITSRWITSFQPNPQTVLGPRGTAALVAATEAMLELDIGYRLAHHADLQWRPST
jgi:ribonuclease Z